jgi:uncharacterized protein (TIGR02270 family)
MNPGLRPILWDIYEEHLDEAAFLWGQWERALVAAHLTLQDVIDGPEERLLAHLDGLVLGGKRVAEKLLFPALEDSDEGKVFAATWALVQAEDADHLDVVLEALPKAKAPARAAMGRALELSTAREDLPRRLAVFWEKSDPPVHGAILDALARDAKWTAEHLAGCLSEPDVTVQRAALRALRRMPDLPHHGRVEDLLRSEDVAVRQEAIATGYMMRVRGVGEACLREAQGTGDACRLPLALLALRGEAVDRELLMARLAVPEAKRHAIWAMGFLGDAATADLLVSMLDDEKVARVAGEALIAITGIVIAGSMVKPGVTKGPGVEDVGPDDEVPEALPEDLLLVPNAAAVRKWWARERGRFRVGTRYSRGEARESDKARDTLRLATMWRRGVLSLAGDPATHSSVAQVRGWARAQR